MTTKQTPIKIAAKPRSALSPTAAVLNHGIMPQSPQVMAADAAIAEDDKVMVLVPAAFPFTLDDHRIVQIPAGAQPMPQSWADHWFVKSRGVTMING